VTRRLESTTKNLNKKIGHSSSHGLEQKERLVKIKQKPMSLKGTNPKCLPEKSHISTRFNGRPGTSGKVKFEKVTRTSTLARSTVARKAGKGGGEQQIEKRIRKGGRAPPKTL